ncbi:MAG: macro domain-containing protein [Alphaproteobacteria bacterium]|nr:macro domain-containing protein [Alphaproteobacteria bacterium]
MTEFVPDATDPSNPYHHLMSRIRLIEGDITQQTGIDAIVTALPVTLYTGGSLNQSIFQAAGPALDELVLENIYRPRAGDVFALPGLDLPVKHVLFAMTPLWGSGTSGEDRDLLRCYRSLLEQAERMKLTSLALPALGAGKGKFPVQRAARLAIQALRERMPEQLEEVRIVCNRKETLNAFAERLNLLANQNYDF